MSLTDILSGNAKKAAQAQTRGLIRGRDGAAEQLNLGYDTLKDYAGRALGEYDAYQPPAQQAYGLYSDALGVNGAEGNGRATAAFQTNPGYEFQQEQGLEALNRTAASRGMLASGNNSADLLKYSQGLADQSYGSWLDRLNGLGQTGVGIAQNRAGIQGGIGQAGSNFRGSLADLTYKTETGIGNANAQQAQAEGAGVLGAISLGTSLLGNLGGIGGIGKSIGGMFGGSGGGMAYNGNQIGGLY